MSPFRMRHVCKKRTRITDRPYEKKGLSEIYIPMEIVF